MAIAVADREIIFIERGLVWRAETAGAAVAAGDNYKIGLVTGPQQLVVTSRSYGSTGSKLTVQLHKVDFTGGSQARMLNRRLGQSSGNPITVMEGVTATLGTAITQATILAGASTGNAQASFIGEPTAIILEPLSSYVVALINGATGAADIGFSFDYRADARVLTFNEVP